MEKGEWHLWYCETCTGKPEFSDKAFRKHAVEVHGLTEKSMGTRRMMQHLDGTKFYQTDYHWQFDGGFAAVESIRLLRRGEDALLWADIA